MNVCQSIVLIITLLAVALPACCLGRRRGARSRRLHHPVGHLPGNPHSGVLRLEVGFSAGPVVQRHQRRRGGKPALHDPWYVHCDADSLVYQGAWPAHSAVHDRGHQLRIDLTCTVNITAERRHVLLPIGRGKPGRGRIHHLTLEHPGGEVVTFSPGSRSGRRSAGPRPGTYLVTTIIFANQTLPWGHL